MSKSTIIPTHFTHLILVENFGSGPCLVFRPIAGIRLHMNSAWSNGCDTCIVTLDGIYMPIEYTSMLYDMVLNKVDYKGELFNYDYDECLRKLGGV